MPRRASAALPGAAASLTAWLQLWEIATVAPQVVAHRCLRLALDGWTPSAQGRSEYRRMISEKLDARNQLAAAIVAVSLGSGPGALTGVIDSVHQQVLPNRRRLARR